MIFKVKGQGHQVKFLCEGIRYALPLFSLDLVTVELRDYYMTFSISALVLARDSHIKPDSEAGELIPSMNFLFHFNKFFLHFFLHTMN